MNPSSPIDIIEGDMDHMRNYRAICSQLRRAGLKVTPTPTEWPVFTKATKELIDMCKEYASRSLFGTFLKNPFSILSSEPKQR